MIGILYARACRSSIDEKKKTVSGNDDEMKLEKKKKKKKKEKEARFAFMTRTEIDHLDDGYRWRKYGQKAVKNSHFPRYTYIYICIIQFFFINFN